MLEILFSDSACGSLKLAQHYGEGDYIGGCVSVIVSHSDGSKPTKAEIDAAQRDAEERMRLAWENAVPMGGNSSDIFNLNLALSIGNIAEEQTCAHRRQVVERLYGIYPEGFGRQAARDLLEAVAENLKTIRERAAAGEPVRIWYSSQPDEMCGLYWFMFQLKQWEMSDTEVVVVKLPEWETDGNHIVQLNSWGDVAPENWHRCLKWQKPMPSILVLNYAARWRELQEENAPLRAVLNGRLISAPETFYDHFILREIEAEDSEFKEANVIGRVLGKYQLGIGDAWIALRIDEMVQLGKLEVVSSAAQDLPAYHRILKKRPIL